jgi:hypothetical protein
MFETFAVLSTISMMVIFVALYWVDRAARREEAEKGERTTSARP